MMCKTLWMLGLIALTAPASAAQTQTQYEISFEGRWTSALPRPSNAHFTTLVGATHNDSVSLFEVGGSASAGVEQVAEIGGTTAIQGEINSLIMAGSADQLVLGTDGFISPEETNTFLIDVDSSHPLLSLLTMIAPSPDWFVGIHDLSLVDSEGDWIPQFVLDLNSYDAGTENGTGLSLNNPPTIPRGVITALDTAEPNGALFGGGSIARLTITQVPAPACDGDIADDFGTIGADGMVSFGDFLALLGLVGPCPGGIPGCDGDIADDFGTLGADGMVSFGDFLALLGLVGPCP